MTCETSDWLELAYTGKGPYKAVNTRTKEVRPLPGRAWACTPIIHPAFHLDAALYGMDKYELACAKVKGLSEKLNEQSREIAALKRNLAEAERRNA